MGAAASPGRRRAQQRQGPEVRSRRRKGRAGACAGEQGERRQGPLVPRGLQRQSDLFAHAGSWSFPSRAPQAVKQQARSSRFQRPTGSSSGRFLVRRRPPSRAVRTRQREIISPWPSGAVGALWGLLPRGPTAGLPAPSHGGSGLYHGGFGRDTRSVRRSRPLSGRLGGRLQPDHSVRGPLCAAGSPAHPATCGCPGSGCGGGSGPADGTRPGDSGGSQPAGPVGASGPWAPPRSSPRGGAANAQSGCGTRRAPSAPARFRVGAQRGTRCARGRGRVWEMQGAVLTLEPKPCCSRWYPRRQVRFPTVPPGTESRASRGPHSGKQATCGVRPVQPRLADGLGNSGHLTPRRETKRSSDPGLREGFLPLLGHPVAVGSWQAAPSDIA